MVQIIRVLFYETGITDRKYDKLGIKNRRSQYEKNFADKYSQINIGSKIVNEL